MKALPLIWKFPDKYKRYVIIPGPFHTKMNYLGMVTSNKYGTQATLRSYWRLSSSPLVA